MAGAFIDLQAMQSLVSCMDGAAEDLRGIKGELVSILGGVDLDTSPPTPLETAAAWVSDQVPGLRRRLAMAQHIQGSNPKFGEGAPIPIDESKLSTLTPAEARQKAQAAAAAMKGADGKPSPELVKEITDNQDDPYYAAAFAKQFSPDQIATVVKQLNSGYPGVDHRADMDLNDDQKAWVATYKDQMHALAGVFGTATRTTSADLKMPPEWTQQWSDVITGKPTTNDDGSNTYGHSLALSLLLKNGTYGTDFITKIADDAYHYERKEGADGDPVWAPKSDDSVWDPDNQQNHSPNRDVMANILKGLGHNPLAAQEFFDGDDSETMKIHGQETTVDSKLKYFIQDRGWDADKLSDDGDGLGDAIRAASTYYRDRGWFGTNSAEIASQTVALIADHDGAGAHGFSLIHGSATSGWHIPSAMQSDVADIMASYTPDLFRAYANPNATGVTPPPWTTDSNPQGLKGDPFGMAASRDDLNKIMKTLGGNDDNFAKVTSSVLAYNQYQISHTMAQMSPDTKAAVLAGKEFPPLRNISLVGPSVMSNLIGSAYDGAKNEEEIKNANTEAMNKFLDAAGDFPVLDLAKVENPVAGWAFDTVKGEILDHVKGEPVDDAHKVWSDQANSMSDKLVNNYHNLMLQNGFYDPSVISMLQKQATSDNGFTGLPGAGNGGHSPAVNYDDDGKPTGFNFSSEAYQNWASGVWDKNSNPTGSTMPDGGLAEEVKQAYITDYGVSFN